MNDEAYQAAYRKTVQGQGEQLAKEAAVFGWAVIDMLRIEKLVAWLARHVGKS